MSRLVLLICLVTSLWATTPASFAQSNPAPVPTAPVVSDDAREAAQSAVDHQHATEAVAAKAVQDKQTVRTPDFLEHVVDKILEVSGVDSSASTATHYAVAGVLLVLALLLRRFLTNIIFRQLKKLASKTETTLDDKLFPALETPVATLIMVIGIYAALKVLKLDEVWDRYISYGSTIAFSLTIFWGLMRAFSAILEHAHEVALERQMGVAVFMPWIKKALITVFVVIGLLLTAQSAGFDVRTALSALGIGGLAFALAAQDTIANLFGSIVVAIDQPFKIGETVRIGANTGMVEDIGLRSTKIRLVDKSLVVLPNKLVSSEPITNLSRFTQRRVEHVLGLTYDTTPEQMEAIVAEIRKIILAEEEIDPASVNVFFRDYNASSLDIWITYATKLPDFQKAMQLRQRVNLTIMRAVAARGLAFAFPTQTLQFDPNVLRQLADRGGEKK